MNAGLNLLRFFLAFNVVLFHLWNAAAPGAGPVAVLGFFFISGFLITQIGQEVYSRPARPWAFLLNRSLRIYPQYAAALAFALLSIRAYPSIAGHINSYLRWPASAAEWLPQLAIFGLGDADVRVLPATWTLGTELWFYLLIGLGTSRSRRASLLLCALSLPVALLCALQRLPFGFYGSPIGNAFVFALGSVAYFYRYAVRIRAGIALLACATYLLHLYLIPALEQADLDSANLAGSVLPFSLILLYLVQHDLRGGWLARLCNVLGKVAYPMFLLHWTVCVLLSAWLFHGLASFDMEGARDGAAYFGTVFAAALGCSLLFYRFIDQPVEQLRRRIRRRTPRLQARTQST